MIADELSARLLDAVEEMKAIPARTIYQGAQQPLRAYRDELLSWKASTLHLIRVHLGRDEATAFDTVADLNVLGVTTQILDSVIAQYDRYITDLVARLRATRPTSGTMQPPEPIPAFCSYSSNDDPFRARLQVALAVLERQRLLTMWEFRSLEAGSEWDAEIRKHLHAAKLLLLLVSPDFFASRYTFDEELRVALERHAAGTARVVPIIVRPCDWRHTDLRHLQALPQDGKPITEWSNPDAAWQNVTEGLRRVLPSMTAAASLPAPALAAALTPAQRTVLMMYGSRGRRAGEGIVINVFLGDRDVRNAVDELIALDALRFGRNNFVLLTEHGYETREGAPSW